MSRVQAKPPWRFGSFVCGKSRRQKEKNHWNGFCSPRCPPRHWKKPGSAWIGMGTGGWPRDYHQCLKSGCRLEQRQLQTVDGLIRLLGLLSPLAVRLLQIRGYARCEPERPAHEVIEPLMLAVVAQRFRHLPATISNGPSWSVCTRL